VNPDVPSVGNIGADDPGLYEQIVQPWDLASTPVTRGAFGYRIRYLKTPTITLCQEQFDPGCQLRGLSPPNVLVFSIPVWLGPRSTYW
jgi:hypothetical protein